jgi:endoglucanase
MEGATEGVRTASFTDMSAAEWVANVRIGWNLGNTFDAIGGDYGFAWLGGGIYADTTVAQLEGAWLGGLTTTQENLQAVADAGFNALRFPVTWAKVLDDDLNIREDWMDRVEEVVNWALDAGLKVMLNSHHDNRIFPLWDPYMEESMYTLVRVWQQIAYRFRDYDERLIFISLNEPRTYGSAAEWSGGTIPERHNINILNQLFVDVVRASGGNNAYRILMMPTYAASTTSVAMMDFVLPVDTIDDRIIAALHIYAPYHFALHTGGSAILYWDAELPAHTNPFVNPLNLAYQIFNARGIPVIIGEMGAMNRGNDENRAAWAYAFVSFARSLGMPSIWWDNGAHGVTTPGSETFGLLDRRTNEWVFPAVMEALMRAVE